MGAKVGLDSNWGGWGGGPGRDASAGDGKVDGSCVVPPKRYSDLGERLDMRLLDVLAGEKDEGSVTRRRKKSRAADRPRQH